MPLTASIFTLPALLLALAGCGSDGSTASAPGASGPSSAHAAPTSARDCNHLPAQNSDPGFVTAGFDWTDEAHAFGTAVPVYVCVSPTGGGAVRVTAPSGVDVAPGQRPVSASGTGVQRFTVTVPQGTQGRLWLVRTSASGRPVAQVGGPAVVAGPDGWHFASAG